MDDNSIKVVKRRPSIAGTLGLLISILVLVLAWTAYNSAGKVLEDSISDEVNRAIKQPKTMPRTQVILPRKLAVALNRQ